MDLPVFATLVVVGMLTGWLGSLAMKEGGHGLIWDLALGLIGSTTAGELLTILGFAAVGGIFVAATVAFAGAAFVIIFQRQIWHGHA